MTTKDRLLKLFEENRGEYFSGEAIAERLEVSRAAVWKAVKTLQSGGYEIDGVRNRGYRLSESSDIISKQGVEKYLADGCRNLDVTVIAETPSTNTYLRGKAENGAKDGTVVIANRQTGGRGRLGRSFYSPSDTGVYLSILLRPGSKTPKDAAKLTTLAAVAACEAIESVSGKTASVKWVNDVFVNGKKVSGILTEAAFGLETGLLDYAVLGIGFNAYAPTGGFPKDIENVAGAIYGSKQNDGKNRLASTFLNRFMDYYSKDGFGNYAEEYRRRSFVIGKDICVISANGQRKAEAVGIDDECRLLVRYGDGCTEFLSSGEISVRTV